MKLLIVGGRSDIGLEIIKDRVEQGDNVFYTCSSEKSLEKAQTTLEKENIKAKGIIYNFDNYENDLVNIEKILGKDCEGIILNACTRNTSLKLFHELSDDFLKETLDKNIYGNLFLLKSLLPSMVERKFGRIVFISSISVDCGTSKYSAYVMLKSALEQLIKNIAVDYGEFNILANTLRLGLFKTQRTRIFWKRQSYIDKMAQIIPTTKLGEVNQIPSILKPLLEENQYINGTTIEVSGGMPKIKTSGLLYSK